MRRPHREGPPGAVLFHVLLLHGGPYRGTFLNPTGLIACHRVTREFDYGASVPERYTTQSGNQNEKDISVKGRTLSLTLALLLGMPALCSADPIYKSTMPDGRVIYGEEAFPGAQRVEKLAAPPANTGVVFATQEDKARGASTGVSSPAVTI